MTIVNEKTTNTLQMKAKSLFSFLCRTYGIAQDQYHMEILKYVGAFIMQPLYKDSKEAGCIAMKDEGHLITLLGYDEIYPCVQNPPALELLVGKLCPESEKYSYRDVISVQWRYPMEGRFSKAFHLNDLMEQFGFPTAVEPGEFTREFESEKNLSLVYRFDKDVQPSKGIMF